MSEQEKILLQIPEHKFEYLTKKHLEEVLEIDCKSCLYYDEDIELEIVHPHAWTQQALLAFIKQRVPPTHGHVLRLKETGHAAAYVAYELLPGTFHLLAFVVDPDHRNLGLGCAMLVKLHELMMREKERRTISVHIREHDDASIRFFSRASFKSKLVYRYFEDGEDAILFTFTDTRPLATLAEDDDEL